MAAGTSNLALQCERKILPWAADSGKSQRPTVIQEGQPISPPLALAISVIEFQLRPQFLREEPLLLAHFFVSLSNSSS
jgi:hypothetical protein